MDFPDSGKSVRRGRKDMVIEVVMEFRGGGVWVLLGPAQEARGREVASKLWGCCVKQSGLSFRVNVSVWERR